MKLVRRMEAALANEDGLVFFPEECETLAANYVRVFRGETTKADAHPDEEEIYVILSGEGTVWLDGQPCPVSQGDAVYIPRWMQHAVSGGGEDGLSYLCVANWPDGRSAK